MPQKLDLDVQYSDIFENAQQIQNSCEPLW